MSNVFVVSDLHFGHRNIMKFAGQYRHGETPLENMDYTIRLWNKRVGKKDKVFVLGDTAFTTEGFEALKELNGRKVLIRGNHDNYFSTEQWLEVFEEVEGIVKYKNNGNTYWLTHAPIHPCELRGRLNIHGHVHQNGVMRSPIDTRADERYINVSMENVGGAPIEISRINAGERSWKQWLSNPEDYEHSVACVVERDVPLIG